MPWGYRVASFNNKKLRDYDEIVVVFTCCPIAAVVARDARASIFEFHDAYHEQRGPDA